MIQRIVRDPGFLALPSEEATGNDLLVARDLLDTLKAYSEVCVGMAANMIGVRKRIIAIGGLFRFVMINPVMIAKNGSYTTLEGCLSLSGQRKTTRYQEIEVEYLDMKFQKHRQTFRGSTAQIIQHEMDHLEGIVI